MDKPPVHPPTIRSMIEEDLGYCCLEFFFTRFGKSGVIADRLGVTRRAVNVWELRVQNGECCCTNSPNCMKKKFKAQTVAGAVRKSR